MKKLIIPIIALFALASCSEFEPVVTLNYDNPASEKTYTLEEALFYCGESKVTTIAELASKYKHGSPKEMTGGMIAGRVSTTDQPGNFYKSLYIQDETGGMEIKIGRNGLYNDYLPGQMLYVSLNGLTLGEYGYKTGNYGGNGMVQVGFDGTGTDYETAYLQVPFLINTHILKGPVTDIEKVTPAVVTAADLPGKGGTITTCPYIGKLITLKGLTYADQNFCLLYINSKLNKKAASNRIFLSDTNPEGGDKTHGITTWAMSREKMTEYICSGIWDECKVGSGNEYTGQKVADFKGDGTYPGIEKNAYSISQYFTVGGTAAKSVEVQVRTSGFCKFADREIPAEVLNHQKTVDITGVLTLYQGSIQITVNNISDFVVDGKPLE